jgi:hypothetical protein
MARRRRRRSAAYGGGVRPQAAHAHPPLGGRPRALRHRGVVWSFRGVLQRAANPEPLHRHDGRNAIAFRRETLDRPRRAGPPATGEAVARTSASPSPLCPSASTMVTG